MITIPIVEEYGYAFSLWLMPSLEEAIKAWRTGRGPYTRYHDGVVVQMDEPPVWFSQGGSGYGSPGLPMAHVHTEEDSYLFTGMVYIDHPEHPEARPMAPELLN